jgi:hypothetical protein
LVQRQVEQLIQHKRPRQPGIVCRSRGHEER